MGYEGGRVGLCMKSVGAVLIFFCSSNTICHVYTMYNIYIYICVCVYIYFVLYIKIYILVTSLSRLEKKPIKSALLTNAVTDYNPLLRHHEPQALILVPVTSLIILR